MNLAVIVFCIIGISILLLSEKEIYNPLLLYFIVWLFMVGLASLRFYDLYEATDQTYFYIFVGLFFYSIGYFASMFRKKKLMISTKIKMPKNSFFEDKYRIRYVLFFLLCFISFAAYINDLVVIVSNGYDFSEVRNLISNPYSLIYQNRTELGGVLRILIVNPFSYASLAICSIEFWTGKRKRSLLIITLALVLLHILTQGDRLMIVIFALDLGFSYIIIAKKKVFTIFKTYKQKLIIFIFFILAFFSFAFINFIRGNESLIKTLYIYTAGAIPHLDIRLNQISGINYKTYMFSTLAGFFSPLFQILSTLGILEKPEIWILTQKLFYVEDIVYIAPNISFNAFVTPILYFYLDLRLFGVCLYSFIFGLFNTQVYKKIKNRLNSRNLFVFLLILQSIVFSMIRIEYASPTFALAFVYLFLYKNQKKEVKH